MKRLVAAAAAAVVIAACNGVGLATAPPVTEDEPRTVAVRNLDYHPDSIRVAAGAEVRWVNEDGIEHTVTHGRNGAAVSNPLFDQALPPDGTFSYVFAEPGQYNVTCTIHPQQNMTVSVE